MISKNISYLLVIMSFSVTQYGCKEGPHHKTQSKELTSSIINTPKTTGIKSDPKEKTAVVYLSTDLGETWSAFAQGIPENATLSGIEQDGNKIYIATDYHGVYLSKDGQNEWQHLKSDKLKNLDINCLEIEGNKLVIGTLHNGILVSDDAGMTWSSAMINIKGTAIRAFMKTDEQLYAGTDSGIFQSTDMGNTWSHVFGKMQILGFTALNNKIYAGTQHGALVCKGDPSYWESIYEGDALHDIGNDGEYIYAMTISQQLLKTQNDGKSWENAQNGIAYPANFYTNEVKHVGSDIFSAQWIGVYHSSDNGANWEILDGLPDSTAFSTLEMTDYGIIAGISIR